MDNNSHYDNTPFEGGLEENIDRFIPEGQHSPEPRKPTWNIVLFLLTVVTTIIAGTQFRWLGLDSFSISSIIFKGAQFSFALLTILLIHEFGHYFMSRRHSVDASLPYFIPLPPPFIIGTLGAIIKMRSPVRKKAHLLDIGAAGPLAGFVASVIFLIIGLSLSPTIPLPGNIPRETVVFNFGESILFKLISQWIVGTPPEGHDLFFHPIAFAGWIGLFVTQLNLLPMGQLDGGHILYAVFGKRHRIVSRLMILTLIVLGFLGWPGWCVFAIIVLFLGVDHPPTYDLYRPLDKRRQLVGWLCLIIFVLTFVPVPFAVQMPTG